MCIYIYIYIYIHTYIQACASPQESCVLFCPRPSLRWPTSATARLERASIKPPRTQTSKSLVFQHTATPAQTKQSGSSHSNLVALCELERERECDGESVEPRRLVNTRGLPALLPRRGCRGINRGFRRSRQFDVGAHLDAFPIRGAWHYGTGTPAQQQTNTPSGVTRTRHQASGGSRWAQRPVGGCARKRPRALGRCPAFRAPS